MSNQYYLTNAELLVALAEHAEGRSDLLADCALRLGRGICTYLLGRGFGFDADEVVQECCLIVLEKAHRFDLRRQPSNPFAYFTQVALNRMKHMARGDASRARLLAGYREFIGHGDQFGRNCQ